MLSCLNKSYSLLYVHGIHVVCCVCVPPVFEFFFFRANKYISVIVEFELGYRIYSLIISAPIITHRNMRIDLLADKGMDKFT